MRSIHTTHHVPYCFPMLGKELSGGLPAVFNKEFDDNRQRVDRTLRIISTDSGSRVDAERHTEIEGVATPDLKMPYPTWFSHRWAMEHARAHTAPHTDAETLEKMYRLEYATAPGSFDRLVEHLDVYPTPEEPVRSFTNHFSNSMWAIIEQAENNKDQVHIVNWQDPHLFFPEVVAQHAADMRRAGIYATGHLHTAWSRGTHHFKDGRFVMKALSNLDVVYGHTESYLDNLRADFADLARQESGLHIPEFRRFDLPIDTNLLDRLMENRIETEAELEKQMEESGLAEPERALLRERLRSRKAGLHCFADGDRADPGKGIIVWIHATRAFLCEKHALGENIATKYRFFSFHDLIGATVHNENDLKEQYISYVQQLYRQLKEEFPECVHYAGAVPKKFVPFIFEDSYNVTAAIHDGLNLMGPEGTYINYKRQKPRKTIMSKGAGFGEEAVRRGLDRGMYFVEPGNPSALADAMARAVHQSETDPVGALKDIEFMVKEGIEKRTESVIVVPDAAL
jgi:hypothetical protein